MTIGKRVWVAGHAGLVGSAVVRALDRRGITALIVARSQVDCTDQAQVRDFVQRERPDAIVLAAAKVGGIHANNTQRADFIWSNLMVAGCVVEAAHAAGVGRLLVLGSSCIYPRLCHQPMREEHLLSGALEPTNEPYAVAKIAGLKLVEAFNQQYGHRWCSLMPTNLYGPNDNYDLDNSHVLPALIRRFHEAKSAGNAPVTLWGTGTAKREFLHVDDLAEACLYALEHNEVIASLPGSFVNVGSGEEVPIRDLALAVQKAVGHTGEIRWDTSRPDGTPRKFLDCSRIHALGWRHRIGLDEGLARTYADFLSGRARNVG